MSRNTPTPPYKGLNNTWLTRSLFHEEVRDTPKDLQLDFDPPFSLYLERPGMVCFRTSFVALMDPTGYQWAMKYLGDWEHWKALMKSRWFQDAYNVAMEEMKMKVRSDALKTISEISQTAPPAQALVAAKYLAGFEWEKGGRGRPSKAEITGELKRQAALLTEEDADAERIGIKLKEVKNG